MGSRIVKHVVLLISLFLLAVTLPAGTETNPTKKHSAKKTSVVRPMPHTAMRKRTSAKLVKVSRTRTSTRRLRLWKETVDRASKGDSTEGDDLNGEDLVVREAVVNA